MSLTRSEVAVVLALYVLGGRGTAKQVAELTKMDVQVVRNAFSRLRSKGLVRSCKTIGGALLLPVMASAPRGREVPYELAKDIDSIFEEYRDSIVSWMKELGIESVEKLREMLEERRKHLKQGAQ